MSRKWSFVERVVREYNWYKEFGEEMGVGYSKVAKIRVEDAGDEYEEYNNIEEFCKEWKDAEIDYCDYDFYNSFEDNIDGPGEESDFVLLVKLWFYLF